MGMFDTIRSSYDLGPGFNKELQTKDLDCLCEEYWIDPAGRLYKVDYSGTQDWEKTPDEQRKGPFDVYRAVSNGRKGKVTPCIITETIEVYPSKWNAHYAPYPRKNLIFIDGQLSDYSEVEIWKERYLSLKRWTEKHYEP